MMSDLKWLDGYSGQTAQQLIDLAETHRIDSILLAFEQAINQRREADGEETLTDEEWTVLAIEAMEREVNNGGFLQFFVNSSNQYTLVLVELLQGIGCPLTADIAKRAIEAVDRWPITQQEIDDDTYMNHEQRNTALEACDSQYFEVPENIEERLFEFIKTTLSAAKS
jgi:hypothetical protein